MVAALDRAGNASSVHAEGREARASDRAGARRGRSAGRRRSVATSPSSAAARRPMSPCWRRTLIVGGKPQQRRSPLGRRYRAPVGPRPAAGSPRTIWPSFPVDEAGLVRPRCAGSSARLGRRSRRDRPCLGHARQQRNRDDPAGSEDRRNAPAATVPLSTAMPPRPSAACPSTSRPSASISSRLSSAQARRAAGGGCRSSGADEDGRASAIDRRRRPGDAAAVPERRTLLRSPASAQRQPWPPRELPQPGAGWTLGATDWRATVADLAQDHHVFRRAPTRLPQTLVLRRLPGVSAETLRDRPRSRGRCRLVRFGLLLRARSARATCWRRWASLAGIARSAIRVSFGWDTNETDLDRLPDRVATRR